jgi:hypothetical protein
MTDMFEIWENHKYEVILKAMPMLKTRVKNLVQLADLASFFVYHFHPVKEIKDKCNLEIKYS